MKSRKTFLDGGIFRSTTSLKCIQCGCSYFPKHSSKDTSKFCSNKCRGQSRSKQTTYVCKHCKKEFSDMSCAKRVFCSKECKADEERVERTQEWIDNRKRVVKQSHQRSAANGASWCGRWARNNPDKVREQKRRAATNITKWYVAKAIKVPVSLIPDSFYEAYKVALQTRRLLKEMKA